MADACDFCFRPVRWVLTEHGRRMPIDPEPAENGNLIIVDHVEQYDRRRGKENVPVVSVVKAYDPTPQRRYISHFATCPNKAAIERRRASKRRRQGSRR